MRRATLLFLPMILLLAILPLATSAWAATEKVLYSFQGSTDGGVPIDHGFLVRDSAGNLYGTTEVGGGCGDGTVFQLSGDGTETVLYSFCQSDGRYPFGGLIRDAEGNFYGTTYQGGSGTGCTGGCGTVFELTGSTLRTLHNFTGGSDGSQPVAALVRDSNGNLYGTTPSGGNANGAGLVYEVSASGKFSVLYRFCSSGGCPDGADPVGGLAIDQQGNLYGTTVYGGARDYGTVYELSPRSGGGWRYSVLHSFARGDGSFPFGGVTLSTQKIGNKQQTVIFGTASLGGGPANAGTAFEMTKSKNGYKLTVLHRFINAYGDGANPQGTLTVVRGKVFGTTESGGGQFAVGTVFELIHAKKWTEKILHSFDGADGGAPFSGVVADLKGTLYGVTQEGGDSEGYGYGVVYEVTP
jgi:uncharacterized repeat protein (TIGR03803 family)